MTWFFAIGEMDESSVSMAALSNMIMAAVGLLNGILIAQLGLPSLIITIATGGAASAIAVAIGTGASIALHTPGFLAPLFTISLGCVPLVVFLALYTQPARQGHGPRIEVFALTALSAASRNRR